MSRVDEALAKLKECNTRVQGLKNSLKHEEQKRKELEWEYRRESVNRVLDYIATEYRQGRLCNLDTMLTHCMNKLNGNIDGVEISLDEHNNGWIACKDRLPEENQKVICSLDNGAVIILDYYGGAFCGVFKYDTNEVIAWQPLHLPPAYRESEEG